MKEDRELSPLPLQYLNRLSDYFFAVARVVNFRQQVKDVEYIRSAPRISWWKKKGYEENEHKEN